MSQGYHLDKFLQKFILVISQSKAFLKSFAFINSFQNCIFRDEKQLTEIKGSVGGSCE